MSKRKQQVTKEEENLKVSQSSSSGGRQYFDMIPTDLIIKILSRLMCGKFMGKCRCLSKLWSSILRGPNYNQLFPIKSPDPPRFLFTFEDEEKLVLFSSPQPQDPDNNSSLVATLNRTYRTNYLDTKLYKMCRPVRGLVCLQIMGPFHTWAVISNPITGDSLTTPELLKEKGHGLVINYYFGYEPMENQFKVLCISWKVDEKERKFCVKHQVITLETGSGNLVWRKIECCKLYHHDRSDYDVGICINGVLYYVGWNDQYPQRQRILVCFDLRYEKFGFINIDQDLSRKMATSAILINYKGKLGVFDDGGRDDPFQLWVLEDAAESTWSKHIYEKPLQWQQEFYLRSPHSVKVIGMTDSGDIVLRPKAAAPNPSYIFYYNLESKVLVRLRLEFPGFGILNDRYLGIQTFPNYVEEVKLI